MRELFLFISISIFSINIFGQSTGSADTGAPKIMIIPFNPDYYFSDADQQLAEYNKKNADQIRNAFRYGVNFNLNTRIINATDYSTENVLNNHDAYEDLQQIYKGLGYKYEKPPVGIIEEGDAKNDGSIRTQLRNIILGEEEKQNAGDEYTNMGEPIPAPHDGKYMNVIIYDVRMLEYLQQKYGADLFIFINQFEVKTHYKHCLDRTTNNFAREILVHFSIFDAQGNQLYGNAVSIYTDSNTRSMDEIIKENISKVTAYISDQLPPERKYAPSQTMVSE